MLQTQAQAIIHFLQLLDIDMINILLNENLTYQDMRKDEFINKLGHAFNEFIEAGDTFLNYTKGFCNSEICNYKCKGYSFVGNNSGNYIDLIIETKEGLVCDIYECTYFKCYSEKTTKNRRIEIDKLF